MIVLEQAERCILVHSAKCLELLLRLSESGRLRSLVYSDTLRIVPDNRILQHQQMNHRRIFLC